MDRVHNAVDRAAEWTIGWRCIIGTRRTMRCRALEIPGKGWIGRGRRSEAVGELTGARVVMVRRSGADKDR
jgi:hypothetical protein